MRKVLILIVFSGHCFLANGQSTLIKNINLVDVKTGKIMPGYSVLFTDGIIQQVAPSAKLKTPADATIIDGDGRYIMPGMADAHIHFFQSGSLYTRPDGLDLRKSHPYEAEIKFAKDNAADYLKRYLRLGITSVVDVGGPMANFPVRDSVAQSMVSPNVLVTGPLFSMVDRPELGADRPIVKITSRAAVDSLMQVMLPLKPDFIKIWYVVTPDMPAEKNYDLVAYIAEQSHKNGLKLAVHSTELNTAKLAVKAGADILVHSVDDAIIPDDFIAELKQKNVTYIPTLIVSGNYYKVFSGRLPNHPQDLAWANPFTYGTLTDPEAMTDSSLPPILKYLRKADFPPSAKKSDSIMAINLVKVSVAGINIATGSDAGNIGTMHASSYLQEQEAMLQAGMTVPAIIKSSTVNVASAFGKAEAWGSIEKGKNADLLLLSKNPLTDLQNLKAIDLVIKSGKVLMPDSIMHESAEAIVQRQLNAYNARDIEAFLATYSADVELYNFFNELQSKGIDAMRKSYSGFFTAVPNLYCKIENRIVMGNTIIDKEKVRVGDKTMYGVAVYEVANGKIQKVTFIQ